jgi:signal recognition particle subunit SRP54
MYDLERFAPQPFISKLLGMGDMATLMDQVKTMNLDKNKDMVKHLEQGIFTIRDMRDQLNNIMKMGPLSKLAGNIPGMGAMFQNAGSDEEGSARMRRMMYMMDSMTEIGIHHSVFLTVELESDGKCFVSEPTRLTRIARGSGTSVREIEELLSQHRVFAQMAKKMGGKGGMMQQMAKAGGPPKNAAQAAALQKKLQQQAAAGGGGGGQMAQAMKMLKDMMGGGGDGGMPDMAAMQNMMSQMGMGGGMPGMPGTGRGGGRR